MIKSLIIVDVHVPGGRVYELNAQSISRDEITGHLVRLVLLTPIEMDSAAGRRIMVTTWCVPPAWVQGITMGAPIIKTARPPEKAAAPAGTNGTTGPGLVLVETTLAAAMPDEPSPAKD